MKGIREEKGEEDWGSSKGGIIKGLKLCREGIGINVEIIFAHPCDTPPLYRVESLLNEPSYF